MVRCGLLAPTPTKITQLILALAVAVRLATRGRLDLATTLAQTEARLRIGVTIQATTRRLPICQGMQGYLLVRLHLTNRFWAMKLEQQEACKTIRGLNSAKAAEWLMENYSFDTGNAGEAYVIMPHRSWSKSDQIKLADYFFSNLPHRSDRGYRAFLNFMALPTFIQALRRHLPDEREERELMRYHLQAILKSHPDSQKYKLLINDFLQSLA